MNADFIVSLAPYKGVIFLFLICVIFLAGIFVYFQLQLKTTQKQYDLLSAKQGASSMVTKESIQAETQQNTDLLAQYKNIRMKSDVNLIILRIASHLPQGALLSNFSVGYDHGNTKTVQVSIDMTGNLFKEDPNEQIAAVDRIYSDLKSDKELTRFVKSVDLVSLNRENFNGRQVTVFNIHCS